MAGRLRPLPSQRGPRTPAALPTGSVYLSGGKAEENTVTPVPPAPMLGYLPADRLALPCLGRRTSPLSVAARGPASTSVPAK